MMHLSEANHSYCILLLAATVPTPFPLPFKARLFSVPAPFPASCAGLLIAWALMYSPCLLATRYTYFAHLPIPCIIT
jgi:hypothetical protein